MSNIITELTPQRVTDDQYDDWLKTWSPGDHIPAAMRKISNARTNKQLARMEEIGELFTKSKQECESTK